ncbi:MAG: ribonuclease H, partial [Candidatus Marinimicrobia bacterium]|nr:ribonuclease H [Candidatus Neomarinimicrobiota bacterium]
IKEFSLFFDYTGIRDWAEKNWRAKNEYTQAYRDFMEKFKDIKIHWEKVAAHSGNRWNERADELAKAATKR